MFAVCAKKETEKQLLSEVDLTFTWAIQIAQSVKSAEKNVQGLKTQDTVQCIKVTQPPPSQDTKCSNCGKNNNHLSRDCRLKNATCFKCQKKGHIATIGRSKVHGQPTTATSTHNHAGLMVIGLCLRNGNCIF